MKTANSIAGRSDIGNSRLKQLVYENVYKVVLPKHSSIIYRLGNVLGWTEDTCYRTGFSIQFDKVLTRLGCIIT